MAAAHTAQSSLSSRSGWLVAAGFFLAAVGLAVEPAQGTDPPVVSTTQILPFMQGSGNSDSNNRMIAVTGTDITGASILYVIDTLDPHIAVYQASGGSRSTRGIRWVGARRIDLDLKVDGWNDQSEMKYDELEQAFAAEDVLPEERR